MTHIPDLDPLTPAQRATSEAPHVSERVPWCEEHGPAKPGVFAHCLACACRDLSCCLSQIDEAIDIRKNPADVADGIYASWYDAFCDHDGVVQRVKAFVATYAPRSGDAPNGYYIHNPDDAERSVFTYPTYVDAVQHLRTHKGETIRRRSEAARPMTEADIDLAGRELCSAARMHNQVADIVPHRLLVALADAIHEKADRRRERDQTSGSGKESDSLRERASGATAFTTATPARGPEEAGTDHPQVAGASPAGTVGSRERGESSGDVGLRAEPNASVSAAEAGTLIAKNERLSVEVSELRAALVRKTSKGEPAPTGDKCTLADRAPESAATSGLSSSPAHRLDRALDLLARAHALLETDARGLLLPTEIADFLWPTRAES